MLQNRTIVTKQGVTTLIYLLHNYFSLNVSFSFATGIFSLDVTFMGQLQLFSNSYVKRK